MIWTLSEPYGARDWWPSKDLNTDKADSVVRKASVIFSVTCLVISLAAVVVVAGGRRCFAARILAMS